MSDVIKKFLKLEAASGIILIMAAMLAMILANSGLAGSYQAFLDTQVQVRIAALDINKPLLLWINDGFMAVFFLLVGLEVKREMLEGPSLPECRPPSRPSPRWAACWRPRSSMPSSTIPMKWRAPAGPFPPPPTSPSPSG